MKILHVCPLYHPSVGGNQIHVQKISERLCALGHEVHVFTSNASDRSQFCRRYEPDELLPAHEVINGVRVRRFPVCHRRREWLTEKLYRVRGGTRFLRLVTGEAEGYWKNGPLTLGLEETAGRLRPDLMLAVMDNSFTAYQCFRAKQKYGIPFAFMPITHLADEGQHHAFLPAIYAAADLLIACTDFEKQQLIKKGVNESKILVIPLGLEPDLLAGYDARRARRKFGISDRPTVAYIGRQDRHKGVDTLVDAMKIIWRSRPDAQLLLAGKSAKSFQGEIDDKLGGLGPEERKSLINIGPFDFDDKKDLYAAADVVVMASNIDCFGLVYLEAWACGRPVIACRNTPQETIIDEGQNGLLVEYGNAADLARKIEALLADRRARAAMGEAGRRKFLKEYNLDHYGKRMEDVYRKLLEKAARP